MDFIIQPAAPFQHNVDAVSRVLMKNGFPMFRSLVQAILILAYEVKSDLYLKEAADVLGRGTAKQSPTGIWTYERNGETIILAENDEELLALIRAKIFPEYFG